MVSQTDSTNPSVDHLLKSIHAGGGLGLAWKTNIAQEF